jgi:hypothetical protein
MSSHHPGRWGSQDGLVDVGQVDLDDGSVFGIGVALEQLGLASQASMAAMRRPGASVW